jgi:hypothetical protein
VNRSLRRERSGAGLGWRDLIVLLVYALVMIAMTYPVAARLSTHLTGIGDDMLVHYWNNWWVKRVLTEGGNLYSTDLLFYPQTVSLVYHNFGWVNIGGWLALEPLVGGIAASNLVYLGNLTLCAFSVFLLARYLIGSEGAAFIAGLVYGCWPYRISSYDHPNTISTQWLVLALFCVILLVREGGRLRHALLAGLFVAVTGFSRWQMLLLAAIAVGAYLLYSVLFERRCWSRRTVGMLALAVLVALALLSVPFYPLARGLVVGGVSGQLYLGTEAGSQTDLLAFVVPPNNHPLARLFRGLDYVYSEWRVMYDAYVGYAVVAIALIGAAGRWRMARPWVALGCVAFLLALGPVLRFNGRLYPAVPMPYRLVGWMPPVRLMRAPHRYNVLLDLPVAVLAGYGVAVLRDRLARRRPVLLWGILSVLVLFDYYNLPAKTYRARVPDFYAALANEPGDFAIAGLPGDRQSAAYYMLYQTVHGHPLLTGQIARVPLEAGEFISSVPMLRGIYTTGTIDTDQPDLSRQLSRLAEAGFRYLVLHKNLVLARRMAPPERLEEWRSYLVVSPLYEDEEVVVYSTTPTVGEDCSLRHELGQGMALIEASVSKATVTPDVRLELDVIWGSTDAPGTDFDLAVALVDEEGRVGQTERLPISPAWPTGQWPADTIVRDSYSIPIEPHLSEGRQAVVVRLVRRADGQPVGRQAQVGEVEMQAPGRSFVVPPMAREVGATFGNALRLLGYDLEIGADALRVFPHWQVLRRMDVRYKFFVHLYDADSGALVAQTDVMPLGWAYPTSWWEVAEIVSDEIELSLDGVPEGTYRLGIGVYHPDTGARLPLVAAPVSLKGSDDVLLLPDEVER